MKEIDKCIEFLINNGWYEYHDQSDFRTFLKTNSIGIDLNETEIVFIGSTGDFFDFPISYFSLVGSLIDFGFLSVPYNRIHFKTGVLR